MKTFTEEQLEHLSRQVQLALTGEFIGHEFAITHIWDEMRDMLHWFGYTEWPETTEESK